MSFLQTYLEKNRLKQMPETMKENLSKLESKMSESKEMSFDSCLEKFGPQVSDLVERLAKQFKNMPKVTLKSSIDIFRMVFNISVEIHQIVDSVSDCVLKDVPQEKMHDKKVEFGQKLTYFVWMTSDPLHNYFNWLPFKKTIEKNLVMWLSKHALEITVDLFKANSGTQIFSVNNVMVKGF